MGQCQGGYIAFEMTRQLEGQGERVAMLGMLDAWPEENTRYKSLFFAQQLANALWTLLRQGKRKGTNARPSRPGMRIMRKARQTRPPAEPVLEAHYGRPIGPGRISNPRSFPRELSSFARHATVYRIRDKTMGWGKRTTGPVEVEKITADHRTMLREPSVRTLAEKLAVHVEQALSDARGVDDLRPGRECVLG